MTRHRGAAHGAMLAMQRWMHGLVVCLHVMCSRFVVRPCLCCVLAVVVCSSGAHPSHPVPPPTSTSHGIPRLYSTLLLWLPTCVHTSTPTHQMGNASQCCQHKRYDIHTTCAAQQRVSHAVLCVHGFTWHMPCAMHTYSRSRGPSPSHRSHSVMCCCSHHVLPSRRVCRTLSHIGTSHDQHM